MFFFLNFTYDGTENSTLPKSILNILHQSDNHLMSLALRFAGKFMMMSSLLCGRPLRGPVEVSGILFA